MKGGSDGSARRRSKVLTNYSSQTGRGLVVCDDVAGFVEHRAGREALELEERLKRLKIVRLQRRQKLIAAMPVRTLADHFRPSALMRRGWRELPGLFKILLARSGHERPPRRSYSANCRRRAVRDAGFLRRSR